MAGGRQVVGSELRGVTAELSRELPILVGAAGLVTARCLGAGSCMCGGRS